MVPTNERYSAEKLVLVFQLNGLRRVPTLGFVRKRPEVEVKQFAAAIRDYASAMTLGSLQEAAQPFVLFYPLLFSILPTQKNNKLFVFLFIKSKCGGGGSRGLGKRGDHKKKRMCLKNRLGEQRN